MSPTGVPTHSAQVSGLTLAEARELMDYVLWLVAILDETGSVLAVNRAWKTFAAIHGGQPERIGVGVDYLAVCDQAASDLDEDGARFGLGLRRVLDGQLETFELKTVAVVGGATHRTLSRVTRLVDPERAFFMVTHEDLSGGKRDAAA